MMNPNMATALRSSPKPGQVQQSPQQQQSYPPGVYSSSPYRTAPRMFLSLSLSLCLSLTEMTLFLRTIVLIVLGCSSDSSYGSYYSSCSSQRLSGRILYSWFATASACFRQWLSCRS